MKRRIMLIIVTLILVFSSAASAKPHHDWSQREFHHGNWQRAEHFAPPFKWHEPRAYFSPADYRMKRLHVREWQDRFPGLRAYKWHDKYGSGFRYQGSRIKDAVLFYNDDDELVSVGFMHDGDFIILRDDDRAFRSRDSVFTSWLKW
jgi:hypothetical protein